MKKKKLKGMSLIEIIISLAVMALLSVILITVGTTIGNTSKATNKLKNKVLQESPYAANRLKGYYTSNPELDEDGNPLDTYQPVTKPVYDDEGNITDYVPVCDEKGNPMYESYLQGTDKVINVKIDGSFEYLDENNQPQVTDANAAIPVKTYNTRAVVEGGPKLSKAGEKLDLKFIDFVAPTSEASTEATTEAGGAEGE